MNNNQNNIDMAKLMSMLSNMDQDKLKQGLALANAILNSKDKDKIIGGLQSKLNNNKN